MGRLASLDSEQLLIAFLQVSYPPTLTLWGTGTMFLPFLRSIHIGKATSMLFLVTHIDKDAPVVYSGH